MVERGNIPDVAGTNWEIELHVNIYYFIYVYLLFTMFIFRSVIKGRFTRTNSSDRTP